MSRFSDPDAGKGGYGPLNRSCFPRKRKPALASSPHLTHRQPVRVAEALRIGPGAKPKARLVHLWATCRWHLVRRASS